MSSPPNQGSVGLWALLAAFPAAVALADVRWPLALFALAGAAVLTGGAVWLLLALTRPLTPSAVRSQGDERWRVRATATDLPPDSAPEPASPTPRVLTAAEVDDLVAARAILHRAAPRRDGTR